ncbi:hypothetical protein VOLCADRAFT_104128 [Volvox carteri f. nagariensis]|uniref:Uncharacterized protein n=1 Tax=Volvox carteri f. nagariensis TaxID=3068 RepID=D8TRE5_VOLCA|nr:uncharacterized protein VOLCADRAFT_104128 [Volvox carteri f. nagariensis]EFJ49976.1 hypothetical protein VOLCADRAFT_104128 [Volvox carteri f. nagariensis]|eukprot:XP_002949041.1 hypothetical protein VOLCADRAFT_104128 [Volvox carteri f. nagariensis]
MVPYAEACVRRYNMESFSAAVGYVIDFITRQQQQQKEQQQQQQQQEPYRAGPSAAAMTVCEDRLPFSGIRIKAAGGSNSVAEGGGITSSTVATESSSNSNSGDSNSNGSSSRNSNGSSSRNSNGSNSSNSNNLLWLLARMQRRLIACSPFMALGGRGDEFSSVAEMLNCVRQGVELQTLRMVLLLQLQSKESKAVPVLELRNRQGLEVPLNAWMYDFYKIHSVKPITRDNEIREGDVWDLLKSATSILKAAAQALELAAEAAAAAAEGGSSGSSRDNGGLARPALVAEALEAELLRLQNEPRPESPSQAALRDARMVAVLFRLIAQDFNAGFWSVGA